MEIMIGTTNHGKVIWYKSILSAGGYTPVIPDKKIEVEEDNNIVENARLKARAFWEEYRVPVLANDAAFYMDILPENEQPGAYVRRLYGRKVTDQEFSDFLRKKLKTAGGHSNARFELAYCFKDRTREETKTITAEFELRLPGSKTQIPGHPTNSFMWLPHLGIYASDLPGRYQFLKLPRLTLGLLSWLNSITGGD